ncbi:unnamed protein product [Choristocarpus tenellus]
MSWSLRVVLFNGLSAGTLVYLRGKKNYEHTRHHQQAYSNIFTEQDILQTLTLTVTVTIKLFSKKKLKKKKLTTNLLSLVYPPAHSNKSLHGPEVCVGTLSY